jgi:uncharacterized protein with GYD domain
MPRYVVLYKFTDQGLKKIKDTVSRAAAIRKENEARGFKTVGTYWTEGHYDIVSVIEAPTEAAMIGGLANIAQAGNVHSETMRAYDESEMRRALSSGNARGGTRRKAPARKRATARRR